jgi:hypothetical protein
MFAIFFEWFFRCFRHMFQVFHLCFLNVASVASRCFKSRSDVAHKMRVGSGRGRERSPREGPGPCVGTGDAGVVERCPGDRGPRVDK